MLIPSCRHSVTDLEIWSAHHAADVEMFSFPRMGRLVSESMDAIREFGPDQCYVCVSWGKDSVAAAHMAWLIYPELPVVHLRPTNHNPDCDAVRNWYLARFRSEYHEIEVDYSGINRRVGRTEEVNKATDKRWNAAIRKCERRFGRRHISGIRADESTGRAIRFHRWGLSSPNGCAPLSKWHSSDVFAYLAGNGLPVHPAYGCLGGGRWFREYLRVAEIGDTKGSGGGRVEWEQEYYGDVLRRIECAGARLE